MHTTTHCKRSLRDEPSQSMKRRMTDICQDGSEYGHVGLHQRSPYERKMGKIIQICHKCNGESKVRANLSKKARAKRRAKIERQDGDVIPQIPMKPCSACDASGLIATSAEDDSGNTCEGRDAETFNGFTVAIIGGGIGGVALAAALQHRNIPCKIYERDTSFEERKQGYGLTMQQGARALRALGFFSLIDGDEDESEQNANEPAKKEQKGMKRSKFGIHSTKHVVHKPDGTVVGEWGMRIWGGRFEKNGKKHSKRQNAHISRQNLRSVLMEMLRPNTIQWGHKLVGYSKADDKEDNESNGFSTLKLKFRRRGLDIDYKDEEEVTKNATILVGADGLRSIVRSKKLGDASTPLRYLGCIVILGIASSPTNDLTDGETVFQTADGTTRLYAMPFAKAGEEASILGGGVKTASEARGGLSMWQLSFPMDESDAKILSSLGPAALKEEALKRCSSWHDPIPDLLTQTPQDLITGYPCYDRELVDKDFLRQGCNDTDSTARFVTLLGDAAHVSCSKY